MAENGTLSTKQRRFVAALVGARSIRDAAKAANVAERSAWRYLADPKVRAEISTRQDSMLAQVTAGIVEDMGLARQVLRAVMLGKATTPGVRVRAAGLILQAGLRFAELVTLAQRVAALERLLAEREASKWARQQVELTGWSAH